MQIQYRIPEANLPELTGRIDKLARRAAKLKLPPISLKTVGHEDVPLYHAPGNTRPVEAPPGTDIPRGWKPSGGYNRYHLIALAGEAPVLPDWDLLAIVEHGDSEVGNVVRTVPGRSLPAAYRTAANLCQHCNTSRRRSETFVLRHQSTGTLKQVGRNCLADFCRDADAAEAMCRTAELLRSAAGLCDMAEGEGFGGGGSGPRRVGAEPLLALTARLIRHLGWVSRSKARAAANEFDGSGPTATADVIREVLFNPRFFVPSRSDSVEDIELRAAARDVTADDTATATAAIEWARGLRANAEGLSDYEHNLLVVLTDETVAEKHIAIACSAVAAYQRTIQKAADEAARALAAKTMTHVGTPGKRELFTVTVTGLGYFDGEYGVRVMVRMRDAAGNALVWWTGENNPLKEGETYTVRGTVKEHTAYKGMPQTVLTRVKVEPQPAASAQP